MNAERPDIKQINQYLQGKLDNRGMHELERAAHDDPFVMDALEGFESVGTDQQADLAELKDRLAERVMPRKQHSVLFWRILPIAACLLLMLGAGYWFYKAKPAKIKYANVIQQDHSLKKPLDSIPPQIAAAPSAKKQVDKTEARTLPKVAEADKAATGNAMNKDAGLNEPVAPAAPILPDSILKRSRSIATVQDNSVGNAAQLLQGKIATSKAKTDPSALASKNLNYDLITVTGVITEERSGEPLTGATIGKKGVGITQADIDGKFTVTVEPGATLTFNMVGYTAWSLKLQPGQTKLDIKLAPNNLALNEVVIRGYVKRNREETTGSSYIITGKEVQDNPVGNVEQLLQGKVAGLNVQNGKVSEAKPAIVKPCTENTKFKDKFFNNIATAERYNFEHAGGYVATISDGKFRRALKFIDRYIRVTVDKDSGLEAFRADKEKWLKWYEDNKCNVIR